MSFRFRRAERLKGRSTIQNAFNNGRKFSCSGAKLFVVQNGLSVNRIVFTFARKYGNAVQRNRSRRLSREAYRHCSGELRPGYDMALLVYPGSDALEDRKKQLEVLFMKAGLYMERG